ncbi:sulfotransferase [Flammeovirga sp. MY04]|uniref:sulfotransferase family protein n=1 Tax=Flammeovirga sp. MY04 TaxID=1191459 RepID=UPI0008062EEF|nr:sulfotransferase [Flammeovirga sp. MY04]ANQ51019.1 sulfotransferase [Flammeovirga sp. MY04]
MASFDKLDMATLSGSSLANFNKIEKDYTIEPQFKNKFNKAKLISTLCYPVEKINQNLLYSKADNITIDKDPVFILGHWRSGTTHLHNLLAKDPQFGFVNTFQSVFPNALMFGKNIFTAMMKIFMPKERPADGLKLDPAFPQEEEFALGNIHDMSFYYFWYFPQDTLKIFDKFLLGKGLSEEKKQKWRDEYLRFAKLALMQTKGERFLSKNPPHTARVDEILKVFPNAKFIYIYRNPYEVFGSTFRFFKGVLPSQKFQEITDDQLSDNILKVFTKMYDKYESDKSLIPEGNLVEVKYEEFSKDNIGYLSDIYRDLNIGDFNSVKPLMEEYLNGLGTHKKHQYNFPQDVIDKVNEHWHYAFEKWDYEMIK